MSGGMCKESLFKTIFNVHTPMLSMYHLCYTSHKEVMYRNPADMNMAFNSLCSALFKTESRCLADSFLPTHHHGCYYTECPRELARTSRSSYTKQFNEKYDRTGPLGEAGCFVQLLEGTQHQLTAITYTARNAVHHGIVLTPFLYPYCSANAYFRKELGKDNEPEILLSPGQIKAALPRRAAFDPSWKMGTDGVFLRESVLETALVENLYATPQAFNYMMSRKSSADWYKEQERDGNGLPPITLEGMEQLFLEQAECREQTVMEMLQNEKARFNASRMTDMQLCEIIDQQYVPRYGKWSVYQLTVQEKNAIANHLYKTYHLSEKQIRRCIVL